MQQTLARKQALRKHNATTFSRKKVLRKHSATTFCMHTNFAACGNFCFC